MGMMGCLKEAGGDAEKKKKCEDDGTELFKEMGGDEKTLKTEKKKAAGKAAANAMKGCMEKAAEAEDRKAAKKACDEDAKALFVQAGGKVDDFRKQQAKAAKDEAALAIKGCYEDAGCVMSDKGKRTCTDKKLEKECAQDAKKRLEQAAGKKGMTATDLRKAQKGLAKDALKDQMDDC